MTKIKPKYIICDLDGCLINTGWIWTIINGMKFNEELALDLFNRMACAEANQIDPILLNYLKFKSIAGIKILFLTARSEIIETETINFLQKKTGLIFGKDFSISSRPSTDLTSPVDSKKARFEMLINNGNEIILAIDDEDEIIRMYTNKGINTMRWSIGFVPLSLVNEFGRNLPGLIGIKEELNTNN